MPPQPKPHLANLPTPVHGGIAAQVRTNSGEVLDFSTCCNPYRPPATIYAALRTTDIRQYPDPDSREIVRALSDELAVPTARLIAASGSTEIIRLAATAFLGAGDTAVMPSPTYGEYELACMITGASAVKYDLNERDDFRLDPDSFVAFSKTRNPSGIFICNPNNPTGQYLGAREIQKIVSAFPDSLIVLDEAYIAFTGRREDSADLTRASNVLMVRSMTKDYSLAGLRLGYAIASEEIITALKKVRPPWNVNSAAQRVGVAALACPGYLAGSMARIHASLLYLTGELRKLGFKIIPTDANFFMFKVGDAAGFKNRMLQKGILVRDCTSFGLPQYVRVAPRSRRECAKFVNAVKETLGETQ